MTASRSSAARLAVVFVLALSSPARSQAPEEAPDAPLELLAPHKESAPDAATVTPRRDGQGPENDSTPAAADPARATAREGIEVAPLDALDPAAIGVLSLAEGGFGLDLWSGTPRSVVESLLPRLPVATASPVMHDLARRLLLSEALLPDGAASPTNLLSVRLERLRAAGEISAASRLIGVAPAAALEPASRRDQVDAAWLAGDRAAACTTVAANPLRDGYWLRARALCRALAGDRDEARLTLGLLDELGQGDAAFSALMAELLGDGKADLASLPEPTAVALAAVSAAAIALPEDAVAGAEPALLSALANLPQASATTRLAAAERAAAAGIMDGAALAAAYGAVAFTPAELAAAAAAGLDASGRSTALLYQAVRGTADGLARADLLRRALDLADQRGMFLAVARAFGPLLAAVQPTPALAPYADALAPALVVSGHADLARMWLDTAARELDRGALWPLLAAALGPEELPWSAEGYATWVAGLAGERARHQAVVLAALAAEGHAVPAAAWVALYDDTMPDAVPFALLRGLAAAAAAGQRGAVVLLGLVALGEAGPAAAGPTIVGSVIAALRQAGLGAEGRAVAIEAVLAHRR